MLKLVIFVFLAGIPALQASNLVRGMSLEEARIEFGRPESSMQLGSRQILIYEDGSRLEFENGALIRQNDRDLPPTETKETSPATEQPSRAAKADPILETDIIKPDNDLTITASSQVEEKNLSMIGKSSQREYSEAIEQMDRELGGEAARIQTDDSQTPNQRLIWIGVSFGIEYFVTLLVLFIAFSLSGFPSVIRQLLLLSLAVASVGAILDFTLQASLLNPVRSGAGFIILLILIRQLTDVREWATAIKIAILARLVSIAIMWAVMIGLFSLFSI
jgi:hypothetical protein